MPIRLHTFPLLHTSQCRLLISFSLNRPFKLADIMVDNDGSCMGVIFMWISIFLYKKIFLTEPRGHPLINRPFNGLLHWWLFICKNNNVSWTLLTLHAEMGKIHYNGTVNYCVLTLTQERFTCYHFSTISCPRGHSLPRGTFIVWRYRPQLLITFSLSFDGF